MAVVMFDAFYISRKWIPTFKKKNPNTYPNLLDFADLPTFD